LSVLLSGILNTSDSLTPNGSNATGASDTFISKDRFKECFAAVRSIIQKFSPDQLVEIYDEATFEMGMSKMTVHHLTDYFSSTMSKTKEIALKFRSIVKQNFDNVDEYRHIFTTYLKPDLDYIESDELADFIEEQLDKDEGFLTNADADALYHIVDMNSDGKVTMNDFLEFIMGQNIEAIKALSPGNEESIIDIVLSKAAPASAAAMEEGKELADYNRVMPDVDQLAGRTPVEFGSFGNGQVLHVWKHRQGNCGGRLKPIIDIQLSSNRMSSAMVLSGYTVISVPIGGQYLWVKRAITEEDEKDAIMDLRITVGKANVDSDAIWKSPGVGWNRVDGNFNPGFFTSIGSFLWYRAARTRTNELQPVSSMLRGASSLKGDSRQARLMLNIRTALRNFIPAVEVVKLNGKGKKEKKDDASTSYDFTKLFNAKTTNNSLTKSQFHSLLFDSGISLDSADEVSCYKYFDADQSSSVNRKWFVQKITYTAYEIDVVIDEIRSKLLKYKRHNHSTGNENNSMTNPLRISRMLSHIFKHVNSNGDDILALDEFQAMVSQLGFYLVTEESNAILQIMDKNCDGRVDEQDFITFLRGRPEANTRKAHRISEHCAFIKRWLNQGQGAQEGKITGPWESFKRRRNFFSVKFPGFIGPEDILLLLSSQGFKVSFGEAKEIAFVISPLSNGRIMEEDLVAFMKSQCRSIGELIAMLERDVMKDLIETYSASRRIYRIEGSVDDEAHQRYTKDVDLIIERIRNSVDPVLAAKMSKMGLTQSTELNGNSFSDVVATSKLKAGIEAAMGRPPTHGALPNTEEWSLLSVLANATSCEDSGYGVSIKNFIDNICIHIAGHFDFANPGEIVSLPNFCKSLRFMLRDEAVTAGKGKGADYSVVFNNFDKDGDQTISVEEFTGMLGKLQLLQRLPEKQIQQLMDVLDRNKTGHLTYADFLYFIESGDFLSENDEVAVDDEEDFGVELGLSSNVPPASITNNEDCDWLAWYLYRQACRMSRRDPENVIHDLSRTCTVMGKSNGSVTVGKLWTALGEHELNHGLKRKQFSAGVRHVCTDGDGSDDNDPVDFSSFCKYVLRMGYTYNAQIQERKIVDLKKFAQILTGLRKGLLQIEATNTTTGISAGVFSENENKGDTGGRKMDSYFERMLRRQDSNNDGLVTVPEFHHFLTRINIHDLRSWNKQMIRKLFEECDNRSDGLMSVAEFGRFIRGEYSLGPDGKIQSELSDDEDDRIFAVQKVTSDSALMRKVSDILMDLVPLSNDNSSPNSLSAHCDAVKRAIMKHFSRHDAFQKGVIAEEHFTLFLQKSGLKNRLRSSEVRKLCSKLRKRNTDNFYASVIDYEKLCRSISPPTDSLGRSRVDAVVLRLQEAAKTSAMHDRSFISLCSLADPNLIGKITKEEFCIVCKMMGCPITIYDVSLLQEALGENAKTAVGGNLIEYHKINQMILTYQPAAMVANTTYTPNLYEESMFRVRHPESYGALPAYAGTGVTHVPRTPIGTMNLDTMQSLKTPGGGFVTTPVYHTALRQSGGGFSGNNAYNTVNISSTDDRSLQILAERIKESRYAARVVGPVIASLYKKLEDPDLSGSGFLPEAMIQSVFDSCDILLTPPDLRAIRNKFRRSVVEDKINYRALCDELRVHMEMARSPSQAGQAVTSSIFQSPAIVKKLNSIRADGLDLRALFANIDYDKHGLVDVNRFTEIVMKYELLQTQRQLQTVIAEFASVVNGSQINYESFCDAVDKLSTLRSSLDGEGYSAMSRSMTSNRGSGTVPRLDTASSQRFVNGSGYDGVASFTQKYSNTATSNSNSMAFDRYGYDSARRDNDPWDRYTASTYR
jgi:Ca2+-binding EF-hand superfamily protein